MLTSLLLQSDRLPEFYRAVREQFSKGGSPTKAIIAILAIAALVLLVYMLNRLERRVAAPVETNDPQRLFRDLLPKLGLTTDQRHELDALLRSLSLPNPAAILLSEKLFDQAVAQAHRDSPRSAESFRRIRARLFPSAVGIISSPPKT